MPKTTNSSPRHRERVTASVRQHGWRMASQGSRALARPTSRLRVLPDYLIVGGQRCGTTTLQEHLAEHPWIVSARFMKGVHYFDTNYEKGPEWYRAHFHTGAKRALTRMVRNVDLIAGEASPYYMFHPAGANRIATIVPQAKIIAILRDPVERAYSHYLHEVRRGFESLSLEEALDREDERLADEADRLMQDDNSRSFEHQHHSYLARGLYHEQLTRFEARFSRENMLILCSEEFFADPSAEYGKALEFLRAPHWTPPSFARYNANTYRTSMPDNVRRRLAERFAKPNAALFAFLGRSLPWSRSSTLGT